MGLGRLGKKTRYGVRPGVLVGFVWLTSDDNPGIQEVTSRQGLAENDAYKSMKNDLVLDILRTYANMRHEIHLAEKGDGVQVNLANKSQIALQHLEQEISAMPDIDPDDKQMVVS